MSPCARFLDPLDPPSGDAQPPDDSKPPGGPMRFHLPAIFSATMITTKMRVNLGITGRIYDTQSFHVVDTSLVIDRCPRVIGSPHACGTIDVILSQAPPIRHSPLAGLAYPCTYGANARGTRAGVRSSSGDEVRPLKSWVVAGHGVGSSASRCSAPGCRHMPLPAESLCQSTPSGDWRERIPPGQHLRVIASKPLSRS